MNNVLQSINKTLQQNLKKNYVDALTIALTINDKGVPENFEETAKQILNENPNIDIVQLVPDGIIRYTYPLKGNEAALGINIFKSKIHKFEAFQSIKNKKMYFAGPDPLRQGGLGIVGRIPVYKHGKFWGFSAVIIRLNTLLKIPEIEKIDTSKYYFQISKIQAETKKEKLFFATKQQLDTQNNISTFITDANWKLHLVDLHPNSLVFPFVLRSLLALLLASLIGFLTNSFFKKPAELKRLLKEQSERLLKNELKFKSVFDQAAVGITYVDTNTGQLLEANQKYCDLLGYTENEIKQKKIQSIVHPDDLEDSFKNFEKLRKGEIREYSTERRHITKSGDIIWCLVTVSPLWAINSAPTIHIAIVENITKRKIAEEARINSQRRIKSLINTIDGIVWECDAETIKFTFISEKLTDILGYTVEEWMSDNSFWVNHIHPEDKVQAFRFCEEQTKLLKNHDFEYRMIAKNGSIVWLRDIVNVIAENGKAKTLRGIMIDITKNKEIEVDLNNSFNVVTEQNKRLLNFSYIVSHNLRSHTSNITSIVDIISTADSEEEKDEMIQLLKSVSDSLNETMLNLNEVVNIQNNIGLITENLNLKQYIDNTLNILADQIEMKDISIISSIK
ncbi:MAG TPA: PAS domain S-box protein, partial [Flavobacterium sp.]|nr:PAS domain S-box protein [Flavobacterium sp.]